MLNKQNPGRGSKGRPGIQRKFHDSKAPAAKEPVGNNAAEDVLKERAIFQPQQAAELHSSGCVVLALESRMEFLTATKQSRGGQACGRGVPCVEAQRDHCVKL